MPFAQALKRKVGHGFSSVPQRPLWTPYYVRGEIILRALNPNLCLPGPAAGDKRAAAVATAVAAAISAAIAIAAVAAAAATPIGIDPAGAEIDDLHGDIDKPGHRRFVCYFGRAGHSGSRAGPAAAPGSARAGRRSTRHLSGRTANQAGDTAHDTLDGAKAVRAKEIEELVHKNLPFRAAAALPVGRSVQVQGFAYGTNSAEAASQLRFAARPAPRHITVYAPRAFLTQAGPARIMTRMPWQSRTPRLAQRYF